MSWLRIDDHFDEHPKILELSDREKWRHVSAMCWSSRYRTGGHIPRSAWEKIGITKALAQKLVNLELWDIHADGGHVIHDWPKYNPVATTEESKTPDPTNADRQARFRENKRNGKSNGSVTPLRNGQDNGQSNGESNGPHASGHTPVPPFPIPKEPPVSPPERNASPSSLAPQGRSLGEAPAPAEEPEMPPLPTFLRRPGTTENSEFSMVEAHKQLRPSTPTEREIMRELFGSEQGQTNDWTMQFHRWQITQKRLGFLDRPRIRRADDWHEPPAPRDISEPKNAA